MLKLADYFEEEEEEGVATGHWPLWANISQDNDAVRQLVPSLSQLVATLAYIHTYILIHIAPKSYKNSSVDEIANVNFYAVRPEDTRIR